MSNDRATLSDEQLAMLRKAFPDDDANAEMRLRFRLKWSAEDTADLDRTIAAAVRAEREACKQAVAAIAARATMADAGTWTPETLLDEVVEAIDARSEEATPGG